jgi:hypothetical protein
MSITLRRHESDLERKCCDIKGRTTQTQRHMTTPQVAVNHRWRTGHSQEYMMEIEGINDSLISLVVRRDAFPPSAGPGSEHGWQVRLASLGSSPLRSVHATQCRTRSSTKRALINQSIAHHRHRLLSVFDSWVSFQNTKG